MREHLIWNAPALRREYRKRRQHRADIQSELRFVADNCDPDTDFMFMLP
jgi:hypothetical protein